MHHVCLMQSFLAKHQINQVTQPPYSPDLVPCNFWLFPKLKSPLEGKKFQVVDKIQENITGQLMVIGRTVWGPKVSTLKGTEVSLSYVQCFLYLASSSINVSIFHITWLDTFWTALTYWLIAFYNHIFKEVVGGLFQLVRIVLSGTVRLMICILSPRGP